MTPNPEQDRELTPGQLSERSGAAVSALHYYEREGLISSRRTAGNQRRYPRHMLRRVAFIRISQQLGIPLRDIRAALATLPPDRAPSREEWAQLSAGWRQVLDERIEQMERLRDDLDGCIGCGCLSLTRCSLYNSRDSLAAEGAGPRLLLTRQRRDASRRQQVTDLSAVPADVSPDPDCAVPPVDA